MANNLSDKIGYLLIQVMKAHRNLAEGKLGDLGLHVGQEMILYNLWGDNGVSQSQLAEHMCVEPPTVTKMVQRMEAGGWIERRPDPDDARVSRVYLTSRSRELEESVRKAWDELEAATVAGLNDMERALLRRLLLQILDNLNEANRREEGE